MQVAQSWSMRQYSVYIVASRSRRLYVGVTNNLIGRLFRHRNGESEFTARYGITRLVYFETTRDVRSAIAREKQIKGWVRAKKIALITRANPTWDDLAADWFDEKGGKTKADPEERSDEG